ncbi:Ribosomal large subunit pseudouridine synthase A [hydrothermal vent metagenome]|uniref:Ribosomal large subunit pseudouridine synthase A n=1 Tax=hydrothermal vent metagenome TaxID=652676 RepID=A0A1W1CY93_9ZZZZ
MAHPYKVTSRCKLLPFLFETLSTNEGWSKKTVKQRLQGSSIFVNGQVQTKHDFIVDSGDVVQVGSAQRTGHHTNTQPQKLEIIYQDKDLIAINKPFGLLCVGTTKENKNHALALLRTQLSRGKKSEATKLWPVHRLDRDTSGILLFATSKEIREAVMDKWATTEKIYLAVVEGRPKVEADTITEPLRLDEKEYRMHVGKHKDAKSAITHYKMLESNDTRSLLEVRIETGRQHQIRAHMAHMGNAIVGDERYGKKGGRMGLHAMCLDFMHPVTYKSIRLTQNAPVDFYALLK